MNKQIEEQGLNLLKKGQKGLFHVVFSRVGLMVVLLVLQFMILFAGFAWFKEALPHIYGGSTIFAVAMVLYVLNRNHDPSAKITWLVIIMALPVFGGLFYIYTQSDLGHRVLKKRMGEIIDRTEGSIPQGDEAIDKLKTVNYGAASLAEYIHRVGKFPTYENTEVTYFPSGEDKFEELLVQLRNAKNFIFLEYFIIDEGYMWGNVLEILAEKVKEGVDVRVIYDGTCEFSTLPHDYPKRLGKLGIKCKAFAPITPFASTHYNYRDHRKIAVIDGDIAFTGGINLADEYINRIEKRGHWKDTAIMLKGEAVKSFTLMFLQAWNIDEKKIEFETFMNYNPAPVKSAGGFVVPYGDCPLDDDKVGERVYMDILNRAQKYVHIMTPYLILDGEMETAIRFAAERGVDVSIILPAIPDKKVAYSLAKTHYKGMLESGVKIYEYTPGFIHAKVFVSDDREAVVGTINLDYRSLYHHFECAAYMYGTDCIKDIERDFVETTAKCSPVTFETIKKEKIGYKILGILMKAVAPLL